MNVPDEVLRQQLLAARCEVCGAKAFHAAAELKAHQPVCVGGELWPVHEITARHFFCDVHKRTFDVTPWVPPEGWTPPADWPASEGAEG